ANRHADILLRTAKHGGGLETHVRPRRTVHIKLHTAGRKDGMSGRSGVSLSRDETKERKRSPSRHTRQHMFTRNNHLIISSHFASVEYCQNAPPALVRETWQVAPDLSGFS